MGEEDRDITQLTLDFEGISLRVSTTRRAAPQAPAPSPKVRSDSSCAGASASGPSSSSASQPASSSTPNPRPVSGAPGLGPALDPKSPPSSAPSPSPASTKAPAPSALLSQLAATFPAVPARWTSSASSLRSTAWPAQKELREPGSRAVGIGPTLRG